MNPPQSLHLNIIEAVWDLEELARLECYLPQIANCVTFFAAQNNAVAGLRMLRFCPFFFFFKQRFSSLFRSNKSQ